MRPARQHAGRRHASTRSASRRRGTWPGGRTGGEVTRAAAPAGVPPPGRRGARWTPAARRDTRPLAPPARRCAPGGRGRRGGEILRRRSDGRGGGRGGAVGGATSAPTAARWAEEARAPCRAVGSLRIGGGRRRGDWRSLEATIPSGLAGETESRLRKYVAAREARATRRRGARARSRSGGWMRWVAGAAKIAPRAWRPRPPPMSLLRLARSARPRPAARRAARAIWGRCGMGTLRGSMRVWAAQGVRRRAPAAPRAW